MTGRLLAAVLVAALLWPARAGWREEAADLRAGPFPPPPELTARYVMGWSGFEAAEARVRLLRGADHVWTVQVHGGTHGAVRSLWQLDAVYESRVAADGWRSLWSVLTEHYRRYRVEETCEFRDAGVRSLRQSTKSSSAADWVSFDLPGLRDMAGALLLARSQTLHDGDTLTLAVFPGESMYLVRARVERREKIRWRGEPRDAIRASLEIDWVGKDGTLKPHKKFHRGTVWVSDDAIRLPLRVEVKVFIGHVFAELEKLER